MRTLTLAIIIMLSAVLCSCRTSRQSSAESSSATAMDIETVKETVETETLLTAISKNFSVEVSDVAIEFYPPDSTQPDARAAPKIVRIGKASAAGTTDAYERQASSKAETGTQNATVRNEQSEATTTKAESKAQNPFPWGWAAAILALAAAICAARAFKNRGRSLK